MAENTRKTKFEWWHQKSDGVIFPVEIIIITSDKNYQIAKTQEVAVEEIQNNSGIQFDLEIVKIFLEKVLVG